MIGDQEMSQSVKNASFSTQYAILANLWLLFIKLKDSILCGIKFSTNLKPKKVKLMIDDQEMSQCHYR